jgi:hypothetical protein
VATDYMRQAKEVYLRYCEYLPGDKLTMQEAFKKYYDHQDWVKKYGN